MFFMPEYHSSIIASHWLLAIFSRVKWHPAWVFVAISKFCKVQHQPKSNNYNANRHLMQHLHGTCAVALLSHRDDGRSCRCRAFEVSWKRLLLGSYFESKIRLSNPPLLQTCNMANIAPKLPRSPCVTFSNQTCGHISLPKQRRKTAVHLWGR